MAPQFNPEFLKAFEPLLPMMAAAPKPAVHDVNARRVGMEATIPAFLGQLPDTPDVEENIYHVDAADGYKIPVYGFTKKGAASTPGPAILHCHGGGMILGSVEVFKKAIAAQVSQTSVPVYSVEYRLAPEHPGTTLVDDCYAGLAWLHQNAQKFNIDTARVAVMGESAGGGIAAGVALMARDKDLQPPLAKQILIYPMLDDRNIIPNPALEALPIIWKNEDNITGWTALLGDKAGKPDADVSPYCAPARVKSVAGLPPTYIDVGTLDIFRDEDIVYAQRLAAENIDTEFHLYPGLPHGFELVALHTEVSKRANENRYKAILGF